MQPTVSITAAETICALGHTLETSLAAWSHGHCGLQPLGGSGPFSTLLAGRIADRSLLAGRRYGAAANLAVRTAARTVEQAGWTAAQTREAWVFVGTSRGNLGETHGLNSERRPIRRFCASNSLHSEIGAAISIELNIRAPWQVISNGCSSGLDAMGLAWMSVVTGLAPRALVVAVDLPLLDPLLAEFRDTHLLSLNNLNDPFAPATTGLLPGEASAAVTVEPGSDSRALCAIGRYRANSDAFDALMVPQTGAPLAELIRDCVGDHAPGVVCPHATGTPNHATAEPAALIKALEDSFSSVRVLPLKPHTGHSLGASGLLDTALLAGAMARGWIPGALSGLTPPPAPLVLAAGPTEIAPGTTVLKIASGMGGHNAALLLRAPGG